MIFSSQIAEESLLGLILFSTFSVGKRMDSNISMYVDDTKLFQE